MPRRKKKRGAQGRGRGGGGGGEILPGGGGGEILPGVGEILPGGGGHGAGQGRGRGGGRGGADAGGGRGRGGGGGGGAGDPVDVGGGGGDPVDGGGGGDGGGLVDAAGRGRGGGGGGGAGDPVDVGGGGGDPVDGGGGGDGGGLVDAAGRGRGRGRGRGGKVRQTKENYSKWDDGSDAEDRKHEQAVAELKLAQKRPKELAKQRRLAEAMAQQERDEVRPPAQLHMRDLKKFFLTTELTRAELIRHYQLCREYISETYLYTVEVDLEDGTRHSIPVTPEKESSAQARRHYIVEFLRESDGARLRVLVEEYSWYIVAFQILYDNQEDPIKDAPPPDAPPEDYPEFYPPEEQDDPQIVKWFLFVDSADLAARFKNTARIKYSCRYHYPEDVVIDERTGEDLFSFMESFQFDRKQAVTSEGETWFDTLFMLISEAIRFALVQWWFTTIRGPIPEGYPSLQKCWLKLSKALFYLVIYGVELSLAQYTGDEDMSLMAEDTAKEARDHFVNTQLKIQGSGLDIFPRVKSIIDKEITFEDPGIKLDDVPLDKNKLWKLCGAQGLQLLKHDHKLCWKLQLRMNTYIGPVD